MYGFKAIALILVVGAVAPSAVEAGLPGLGIGEIGSGEVGGKTDKIGGILPAILGKGGLIDDILQLLGLDDFGKSCGKDSILGVLGKLIKSVLGLVDKLLGELLYKVLCIVLSFVKSLFNGLLPGLGTALVKIIYGILYFVICLLDNLLVLLFGSKDGCKICKIGWDKSIGMCGNMTPDKCKEIIAQGYKEGQACLDGIDLGELLGKVGGFLKIIIEQILGLLGLGKKCGCKKYDITANDGAEAMTYMVTLITSIAVYYGQNNPNEILYYCDKHFKSVFGKYGWDCEKIKKNVSGCKDGDDLEYLQKCWND